jgi:hypothetical protein
MLNINMFNHNHHSSRVKKAAKIIATWNPGDIFLAAFTVIYHGIPSCRDAQKSYGKTYALARLLRNTSIVDEK